MPTTNQLIGIPSVDVSLSPVPLPPISVPVDVIGIVGTATWGAVNSPTRTSYTGGISLYGNPQTTTFDMMTQALIANLNGADDFVFVRVTDGTDVAASALLLDTLPATGVTLTSRYTGTLANTLKATIGVGSSSTPTVLTYKLTVFFTGQVPEIFDNIGGTGATFWANLAAAVNLGQSGIRPPSNFVVATVGAGVAVPALTTYTLSGGTNGNSGVTSTTIIGTDGLTRTGMYCFRETPASLIVPADLTDTTKWAAAQAFAEDTKTYMAVPGAVGQQDSITTAVSNLQNAGINSGFMVVNLGDWVYFSDTFNNQVRLGNPSAFRAGILSIQPPENGVVGKSIRGIVDTQKSRENRKYSIAELDALRNGRIDVIGQPIFDNLGLLSANGKKFNALLGINTSSNPLANHDNYPRMNFYLKNTTQYILDQFIGQTFTKDTLLQIDNTLKGFYQPLLDQERILGYRIVADASNNPQSQLDQGIIQVLIQVKLAALIINIFANLDANQGANISISVANQ